MNKKEIILKGYLESYLTNDLSSEEITEVESLIAADPEVQSEYLLLQMTLEQVSFQNAISPDTSVKRKLMEHPMVFQNAHLPIRTAVTPKAWKLMMAASVIITLTSAFAALYFWSAWKSTDERLALLLEKNTEITKNYQIVNQELTNIREDLAILINPEFSRIILNGTKNAPASKAVIYWDPEQAEVYLNSANLAQLPVGQQYQLWALLDGKPADAGVFDSNQGSFQVMKSVTHADAFAVTIEKTGGAKAPTLETMQVYGAI